MERGFGEGSGRAKERQSCQLPRGWSDLGRIECEDGEWRMQPSVRNQGWEAQGGW